MFQCVNYNDFSESIIGDYMPEEISVREKRIRENNAMKIN